MEKQADYEQNLNIQQKYVAELDNNSIFVYFFNYFKHIKSIISKFNIHTEQSDINLCNPAEGQDVGEFQEKRIHTKIDNNISARMEVIQTKLLPAEVKMNQKTGEEPAKGKPANDVVEQKTALIPNPRLDVVGLLSPRYIKSSDSSLVSTMSNSEFIDGSHLCTEELAPIGSISSELTCTGNKKILNFADINTLKLATLIQTMMIDVLNLTQNVNDSQVSIEGLSFKVTVDIRKGKQGAIDSTEINDNVSSISKQLAFEFKDVLPAMDNKEFNTITSTRMEKQPQDEILHDDQLLVVEDEQEMSTLADSVYSDDTLTLENVISVVDMTCYDELNKQELNSIDTTGIEVCSDDTSTLENRISILDLTCNSSSTEFIKQEFKAKEANSIDELPPDELLHGDKLPVAGGKKKSSVVDGVCSDDPYTVENRITVFDLTCNGEFNKHEIKEIVTTCTEELPQDKILYGDQLRAVNREEEIPNAADTVCSKKMLIVQNSMSIQDFKCNDGLRYKNEQEISTMKLNLGFKKMITTDINDKLTEITRPELNNELIEITSAQLNNDLKEIATMKWNNELREIKSKDEVKQCSAMKLSDKKYTTIDVNEASASEHSILKVKLSVSKYCSVTENFLKILSTLNDTSAGGPLKSSVMVPAFYFRNWYFQNIRQGFLLNIMLKKANVSILNYMRNLYFVIITTDSQNISIAINFALQNEIFLHFKDPSIYFTGNCCKYTVSAKEVQQIFSPETGIVESCTTYEESDSTNTNTQSRSDLTSLYSTLLAEKINAATSYLYFDLFDGRQRIDVAVGESNFELQSNIKLCNIPRCTTWFTSTLNVQESNIGTFFIHDVNETVFEQFSVDRYIEAAFGKGNSSFFSSAGNSNFYNIFFKCLGHTIACTMLSFFISML